MCEILYDKNAKEREGECADKLCDERWSFHNALYKQVMVSNAALFIVRLNVQPWESLTESRFVGATRLQPRPSPLQSEHAHRRAAERDYAGAYSKGEGERHMRRW